MDIRNIIRNVPDFPIKGIQFKDITTLLKDKEAFRYCVDQITQHCKGLNIDYIAGIEARGFIIGAPVAYSLDVGFIPIRKGGRLPYKVEKITYQLEYGESIVEIHQDAFQKGNRIMVVDDLLATGGTTLAVFQLIERLGGVVVGADFIIELEMLQGREKLKNYPVFSLVKYKI
ncbi:MAG: adenine phosphoribosyltransferase [Candidatus Atribacteria bacterium]|jgi:adenine phosphoribosyltransferase|nr:adenine phosphoribosyltransferase [Candidatus Atribacteria bacterium]